MYILTIKGHETEGAYSVVDREGEEVLFIFEEQEDADRFVQHLDAQDYPEMVPMKVDEEIMIEACEKHGHKYTIITPQDVVILPDGQSDFV